MKIANSFIFLILYISLLNCSTTKHIAFAPKTVYQSQNLTIIQVSDNSFNHISYKQTDDFGNVPCNGLIVRDGQEVIIFDTPTNDKNSEELIKWVNEKLNCKINAIVPTHFHDDCLGGLNAFEKQNIASFANYKTIELAKENKLPSPKNSFSDSISLKVGSKNAIVKYFGEGHTKDNVVAYFPSENVMFGGCLVKSLKASKGFLGDANLNTWSNTVMQVKKAYPAVRIVIPGHGNFGNNELLDYTIQLFKID